MIAKIIFIRMGKTDFGEDLFGFLSNLGRSEAILTLRLILEDRLRNGKLLFKAFVDMEKAFENIDRKTILEILTVLMVKYRELKVI